MTGWVAAKAAIAILVAFSLAALNPVYWLVLAHPARQETLTSVIIAIAATLFGNAALGAFGIAWSTVQAANDLRASTLVADGRVLAIDFEDLRPLIPSEVASDLAAHNSATSPLWRGTIGGKLVPMVRVYVADPDARGAGNRPPGIAFVGGDGTRLVVLRDRPRPGMRPWQRFLILHELAHVSTEGAGLHVASWRLFFSALNGLVVFALLFGWASP